MPRTDVRPLIAEYMQKARAALERDDEDGFRRAAERLTLLLLADEDARRPLTGGDQGGNTGDVVTRQNVRVSLRAIAEAMKVSHALLSQARAGKRRIRRSLAEKIAKVAPGMPANARTWPKGWVTE